MNPSGLTKEEEFIVERFTREVEDRMSKADEPLNIDIRAICEKIGLKMDHLHKEGPFLPALWIALLKVLDTHLVLSDMKYPTLQNFLTNYQGRFDNEAHEEQKLLWCTANWMALLFTFIPARKNKGLAIQVVSRFIEGSGVRYVTGGGQSKNTANRVRIYETEGGTTASRRMRKKAANAAAGLGRRSSDESGSITSEDVPVVKSKKRKIEEMHYPTFTPAHVEESKESEQDLSQVGLLEDVNQICFLANSLVHALQKSGSKLEPGVRAHFKSGLHMAQQSISSLSRYIQE